MSDSSEMHITNYMSLRILHEALEPDDVSRVLGLAPDRVRRRGDIITKTTPARGTGGCWARTSNPRGTLRICSRRPTMR